jgi:uncharacterized protein YuzE
VVTISRGLIDEVLSLPARQLWAEYDAAADVLYLSFRKPQQANDSVMEEDGNIYHYRGEELAGITVLNASKPTRSGEGSG